MEYIRDKKIASTRSGIVKYGKLTKTTQKVSKFEVV